MSEMQPREMNGRHMPHGIAEWSPVVIGLDPRDVPRAVDVQAVHSLFAGLRYEMQPAIL